MSRTAIYPGSFDPFTFGHLDIIERGSKVFDKMIVAVAHNVSKKTTFTIEERVELIQEVFRDNDNIEVDSFSGLLVDYIKSKGTNTVIRGMRSVSDFEYELQLAQMNRELAPEIETLFLTTSPEYSFLSSTLVKEIVKCGGEVAQFVAPPVLSALKD